MTEVYEGDPNIFAEIGVPEPETHLLKAKLVVEIMRLVRKRELTQVRSELTDSSVALEQQRSQLAAAERLRLVPPPASQVEDAGSPSPAVNVSGSLHVSPAALVARKR